MKKPFWFPGFILSAIYFHRIQCKWSGIMSVPSLSRVQLFVTPWIAACQASLSITNSQSPPKLMSIESVMPSNHLILCHPLLLLPSIFPSIRVFSNELALCIRWPKYWNFSFSIIPSNEHPGLISFRMDCLDLLAVQGTLKSLLRHHSSKASLLRCSAFFTVQLSHPYSSEVVQSCLTLCDPVDCSLLGSSVHGIFQARVLEWVAISFCRGSSQPRDWTHLSNVSCITGRFFTTGATHKAKQNKNPDQMIVKVLSENLWLVSTSLDKLTSRGFHLMKFWEILLKSVPKWK